MLKFYKEMAFPTILYRSETWVKKKKKKKKNTGINKTEIAET